MGLGTISVVVRGSLPIPNKLGHRPSTLTALCSWIWHLLLTQTPSARLPVPSVLYAQPARPPARPGSTAATPHLSVPSQDGICQLPVLGLLFMHMEPQDIPLLQEIGHHGSIQVFLHSAIRVPSWLLRSLPPCTIVFKAFKTAPISPQLFYLGTLDTYSGADERLGHNP